MPRSHRLLAKLIMLNAAFCMSSCATAFGDSAAKEKDAEQKPGLEDSGVMLQRDEQSVSTLPHGQLSPRALELADLTGIHKVYVQLRKEQDNAKTSPLAAQSLEAGFRNQRIIYLHDKLNQYFLSANLEIESTIAKLNSEMSALGDRKAVIADERARVLRRNTFINLISGGLTKIGGYSNALTEASLIPTNVLEIFDGGVQTSLSASTIRQQRGEKRASRSQPEMLLAFINGDSPSDPLYPPSVWNYLNAKANTNDRVSRRATLIAKWRAGGRLNPGGSSLKRRTNTNGPVSSFDDLDDTTTMLADIRAVLSGAQIGLMELSETLKVVYEDDPVI